MRNADEIDEFLLDRSTQADERIDIGGTSRVGTLKDTSRKELRRRFGEPDTCFPKSTYHWQVRFPDGTVLTIYDYYSSNAHADDEEEVDWSIGGRDSDAVELLQYLELNAETVETAVA